ncbi:aspartate/glutamate racemase family protein [Leifsonia sp. NPDC077715]|uniref:aspartate/glutamate racemase family protein n=1 Tax=Leifsonia sp. NPDC077715 TaxID=3155539 RepID=UPI0034413068
MAGGAMIAGLLHTVPALAPTFDGLVADAVPGTSREHVVDAWMLETAIAEGVTPAVRERVAAHLRHLAESGADAILVTCSSIGEAAEEAAASLGVPVIRVDAAMAAEAARLASAATGAQPRIAVLATNTATLGPTTRLIEREAAAQGVRATVTATVVDGAAAARAAGDQATHDRLIADAVRAAANPAAGEAAAAVLVLAQASMAPAAESAGVDIPVLTSPAGGVARLAEALTPSDPGTPDASANRAAASGSDGTSPENGATP